MGNRSVISVLVETSKKYTYEVLFELNKVKSYNKVSKTLRDNSFF